MVCEINRALLPFKLHYFFFYGALGGVYPFIPVIGKDLGISATAVGLTFTILQFSVFVSRPLVGYLTDYFRNIKLFILCLLIVTCVSSFCLLLIPPIEGERKECAHVYIEILNNSQKSLSLPFRYDKLCIENNLNEGIMCPFLSNYYDNSSRHFVSQINFNRMQQLVNRTYEFESDENIPMNSSVLKKQTLSNNCVALVMTVDEEPNVKIAHGDFNTSSKWCKEHFRHCLLTNRTSTPSSSFEHYQFWIYFLLVVLPGLGASNVFSLFDVACNEVLGEKRGHYGRQRLWGTVGWAVTCTSTGLLNDVLSGDVQENKVYSQGFYVMIAFMIIDALILIKVPLMKTKSSLNIFKDVKTVFSSCEIVTVAVGALVIGVLTGVVADYEFWYLEDLGASRTLLGLTVSMQCLAAELPFFIISGWFIKKFGYLNCITGSFAGFALRLGLYSIIQNPWFALPIDTLHGVTFAMFHASLTAFASVKAPPGVEATMLGIFGGLCDGLGHATGSLLGGAGFDKLGGRRTYFTGSMFSIICTICFTLASRLTSRKVKCNITENRKDISPQETPNIYILD